MVSKRKAGEKGENLLNQYDIVILKILDNSKEDIGMLELGRRLNMGHLGVRRHVSRLHKYGLITKTIKGKTKMIVLKTTEVGRNIIKIFDKK